MHFKRIAGVAFAVAALTVSAAGATAAQANVRPHATPACGFNCANLFSEQLGHSDIQAVYVPNSNGMAVKAKVGTKIDLKLGNDQFTNQDFTATEAENVGQACSDGHLAAASYACIHFAHEVSVGDYTGNDPVLEVSWSPDGNQSGLCEGVALAGVAGENATLQNCGDGPNTLWVIDLNAVHKVGFTTYAPAILGSDANTTQPLVLQVNTGTKAPQNQLVVNRLLLQTGGFVPNQDMWSFFSGPAL